MIADNLWAINKNPVDKNVKTFSYGGDKKQNREERLTS